MQIPHLHLRRYDDGGGGGYPLSAELTPVPALVSDGSGPEWSDCVGHRLWALWTRYLHRHVSYYVGDDLLRNAGFFLLR